MKSHAASFSFEVLVHREDFDRIVNAPNDFSRGTGTTPNLMSGPFFLTNGITQLSRMNIDGRAGRETLRVVLERPVVGFLRSMQMLDMIEQHARRRVDVLRDRHLHGAGLLTGLEHLLAGELIVEVAELLRAAGRAGEAQRNTGAGELARRILLRQFLGILPDFGVGLRRAVETRCLQMIAVVEQPVAAGPPRHAPGLAVARQDIPERPGR